VQAAFIRANRIDHNFADHYFADDCSMCPKKGYRAHSLVLPLGTGAMMLSNSNKKPY
jgi:hypothetical protein